VVAFAEALAAAADFTVAAASMEAAVAGGDPSTSASAIFTRRWLPPLRDKSTTVIARACGRSFTFASEPGA
jgi:hypothetical protein